MQLLGSTTLSYRSHTACTRSSPVMSAFAIMRRSCSAVKNSSPETMRIISALSFTGCSSMEHMKLSCTSLHACSVGAPCCTVKLN